MNAQPKHLAAPDPAAIQHRVGAPFEGPVASISNRSGCRSQVDRSSLVLIPELLCCPTVWRCWRSRRGSHDTSNCFQPGALAWIAGCTRPLRRPEVLAHEQAALVFFSRVLPSLAAPAMAILSNSEWAMSRDIGTAEHPALR